MDASEPVPHTWAATQCEVLEAFFCPDASGAGPRRECHRARRCPWWLLRPLVVQMVTIDGSMVTISPRSSNRWPATALKSLSWQFPCDPRCGKADRGMKRQNSDVSCHDHAAVAAHRTKTVTMTRSRSEKDGTATNGSEITPPWDIPLPSRQKNTCVGHHAALA